MKDWRLYGMWCVLDIILVLFLFALTPVILNIYIAQGLFYYFHLFIATIAGLLLIATFVAFQKGSLINIPHRVIKGATDWWEWIIFHWVMTIILGVLTAFLLLITTPVIENPSTRFLGLAVIMLYIFFLIHFTSIWQYFYLKSKSNMLSFFETLKKCMGRRLRQNLSWLIFPQVILFVLIFLIEIIIGVVLPSSYERIDARLVRCYYLLAVLILYVSIMRNRKVLFG